MCVTVNLDHPGFAVPTFSLRVWHLHGHNPNAEFSCSQDTGSSDKPRRGPGKRGEGTQAGAAVQISRAHLLW